MYDFSNYNTLPTDLDSILNSNTETMDYFASLDASDRNELIHYSNDFVSKEELERYLYYAMNDNYKNDTY